MRLWNHVRLTTQATEEAARRLSTGAFPMVTFEELAKGETNNGDPIPSRENPFYHIRVSGEKTWSRSGKSVYLKDTITRKPGQVEMIIRQGHWVKVQIRQENWGHYGNTENYMESKNIDDEDVSEDMAGLTPRIRAWNTGFLGDSILQLTIYGGGSLATSSESLDVSEAFENMEHLGNTSWFQLETSGEAAGGWGGTGTFAMLAPYPPLLVGGEMVEDPRGARRLRWGDADDGCRVTLLDWGLTIDDSGQTYEAVEDEATSRDSDNRRGVEIGSQYLVDQWNTERFGDAEDPEGWFYTVTTAYESNDQIYRVFVNGVQMGDDYYTEEAVNERAQYWLDYYKTNPLPQYLKRERGQSENPPDPEAIPDWLKWAILIGGGALGAYFLFTFTRSLGNTAGQRLAESA